MPLLTLIVPQTVTFCLAMFQLLSHYHRNCLVRCDYCGLSFCLKVIILCPPTPSPRPRTYPCCRHNPIVPHTPLTSTPYFVIFLGLCIRNFGPYLCRNYSYTGRIWNNLPASCVFWLLSLQMPNKIKTVSAQGTRLQLFT
jgi:hypothetical protein